MGYRVTLSIGYPVSKVLHATLGLYLCVHCADDGEYDMLHAELILPAGCHWSLQARWWTCSAAPQPALPAASCCWKAAA